MTICVNARACITGHAATEPAHFERDDGPASENTAIRITEPQRSPLILSGMTPHPRTGHRRRNTAATEPAHFEREDLAAMTPSRASHAPQRSPVILSGMTAPLSRDALPPDTGLAARRARRLGKLP